MTCYTLGDLRPTLHPDAYVAREATLIGNVTMEAGSSLWPGAVIRADHEPIVIGQESNLQENVVVHVDPGHPVTVGQRVTVGHLAMLHGCTIHDESLIGIQAVILNGAVIPRHCLVGAGALVTEGKTFPEGSLILGSPARVARKLTDAEIEGILASARGYARRAVRYRDTLRPL